MKTAVYPSRVVTNGTGSGLFAAEVLEESTVVEKLAGRIIPFSKIPEAEIPYAFEVDDDRWVIAQSNARHINHSCDPNCRLSRNMDIKTQRRVSKGEELTLRYNVFTLDKYMKAGAVLPRWNDRRNFTCVCGSTQCVGRVDHYVVPAPSNPNSRNLALGVVEGRGRGVFAARKISKGELIERSPVIVIPEKQWPGAETTVLSDYAFDWGEKDQHAAIALGYMSLYNHSYSPNARLDQLLDDLMMEIFALTDIDSGEEILINYNGDPEAREPLWFTEPKTPKGRKKGRK